MTYERLGVRRVVNGVGVYTDLGGVVLSPRVWAAMTEANAAAASLPELLDATGRRVAALLAAGAARVVPGASAGIALATAACIARGDGGVMERLPDAGDRPREVVIQAPQRAGYKYLRMVAHAGGVAVEAEPSQLEEALDPARVAALFVPAHLDAVGGSRPLAEAAAVAHERGIPTIVDAAYLNYPPERMASYTAAGADLACFSAKYFHGPNGGGLVVGREDLVAAVAGVDFTGYESGRWLVFGRPFKLDRHTVVGTLVALEEWLVMDHAARWTAYARMVDELAAAVADIDGVSTARRFLTMEEDVVEREVVNALLLRAPHARAAHATLAAGDPAIAVHLLDDALLVAVDAMLEEDVPLVAERLRAALSG
ncbi:MAG: aminotransferase class V-fold PLP-dependent enzyme [Thermoleophilia bacterium]|nr:aminotransferase class V-fold PLP-dependent enzyme [Thermoleophilia bacterium]MDH4346639.1 aminotransferase class V-fold PLP-dependent enzyme [Thermoleophilia bacterium]